MLYTIKQIEKQYFVVYREKYIIGEGFSTFDEAAECIIIMTRIFY